jgi:hypothetical protein
VYFDETTYLQRNGDVREAVARGLFQSGYQHFVMYGARENRLGWPSRSKPSVVFSVSHNRNYFSKLGDLCIAHPTFNAVKDRYPSHALFWLTRKELAGVTGFESPLDELSSHCVVIDAAPPHRHASQWLHSGMHPIDFVAESAGFSLQASHRVIDVPVLESSTRKIDSLDLPRQFAVIAAGPCYTGGRWEMNARQEVADLCARAGIACVSLGGTDSAPLQGTIDLCGQLTPNESVALIGRSQVYVGPDTGTSWLACAARTTPKVCVVDRDRLKDGVVGFQGFLDDGNIRDVFVQDGPERCFEAVREMRRA